MRETYRRGLRDAERRGRASPVSFGGLLREPSAKGWLPNKTCRVRHATGGEPGSRQADGNHRRAGGYPIGMRRHGGTGGDAPARAIQWSAGLPGFEGAESLASPGLLHWLPATTGSGASCPKTVAAAPPARRYEHRAHADGPLHFVLSPDWRPGDDWGSVAGDNQAPESGPDGLPARGRCEIEERAPWGDPPRCRDFR